MKIKMSTVSTKRSIASLAPNFKKVDFIPISKSKKHLLNKGKNVISVLLSRRVRAHFFSRVNLQNGPSISISMKERGCRKNLDLHRSIHQSCQWAFNLNPFEVKRMSRKTRSPTVHPSIVSMGLQSQSL